MESGGYTLNAMGYIGTHKHDFTGIIHTLPLPVLILLLAVFVIAVFGLLSRVGSILKGKGTAVDFLGIIILIIMFALVAFIFWKGLVRGVSIF